LVPVSVYLLKTNNELTELGFEKTKNSIKSEINCIVVEDLRGYQLRIAPGKNTIGISNLIKDSVSFEYRRDTMFLRERNPPKSISRMIKGYDISLNLTKCPSIIAHNGIDIYIKGFNEVKNNIQLKLSGTRFVSIDSLSADSIDLELHQGQSATLGENTRFKFVFVQATDSASINLYSKEIKTIKAEIEPSSYVSGRMRNINKLSSKK
jgi:hypothetical protein